MQKSSYFNILLFIILLILNSTQIILSQSSGSKNMVVSASDLASKVGIEILRKGGNAVDAAVATGFALAVTYPLAGNIGGGGFMTIHLADGKNLTIDYREKAPLNAHRDMYLDETGEFISELSTRGETASGVPGSVAGLIYALENYGTMKLSQVIQPAINLANDGFPLPKNLAESLNRNRNTFKKFPSTYKVFGNNDIDWKEGDILKQKDLAKTLLIIKEKGKDGFYKGEVADLIIAQMKKGNGYISHEDLIQYSAIERIPVIGTYKDFKIVSMGPPSSGGIALIQILQILENVEFDKDDWASSKYYHFLIEAFKLVYADRSEWLGDEDFFDVPKKEMISKAYSNKLFNKIKNVATPSIEIQPDNPRDYDESTETTHYSVYDSYGNAVSTTTTINSLYGSKVVVEGAGFFLNNEMDDFSAKPGVPNQFGLLGNIANEIEPGKRMLSAMTPTIVLKNEKPFLIVGSPGGSTIITVVACVILNSLEFGMNLQQAVSAPRVHHQWFPDEIQFENFAFTKDVKEKLESLGHKFGRKRIMGRVDAIMIDSETGKVTGITDPRGDGRLEGF